MVLPDKFKCVITNWEYIYDLCRHVSNDVKRSGYKPDTIIAWRAADGSRAGCFAISWGSMILLVLKLNIM